MCIIIKNKIYNYVQRIYDYITEKFNWCNYRNLYYIQYYCYLCKLDFQSSVQHVLMGIKTLEALKDYEWKYLTIIIMRVGLHALCLKMFILHYRYQKRYLLNGCKKCISFQNIRNMWPFCHCYSVAVFFSFSSQSPSRSVLKISRKRAYNSVAESLCLREPNGTPRCGTFKWLSLSECNNHFQFSDNMYDIIMTIKNKVHTCDMRRFHTVKVMKIQVSIVNLCLGCFLCLL